MTGEPQVIFSGPSSATDSLFGDRLSLIRDYYALTKPEISFLILITTTAGFYLASVFHPAYFTLTKLSFTVLGTLLLAGGLGTLNQVIERRFDAQMSRTVRRPIAAGRVAVNRAAHFGIWLTIAGTLLLFLKVNILAGSLGLCSLVIYLFLYTPLKRKTPLCTLAGAAAGAMPPLIGWVACGGGLDSEAAVLFALLFLWQFPHFMAIAWIYRNDYARAGYRVLPMNNRQDRFMSLWTIIPMLALIVLLLLRTSGQEVFYVAAACILGFGFLFYGIQLAARKTNAAARHLLTASILYLPLALGLLILAEIHRLLVY